MLPFKLLLLVYIAIAESIISYGLLSWGSASPKHLNLITNLQNSMIRTITPYFLKTNPNYNSISMKYNFCNLLPVSHLFKYRFILKFYFNRIYEVTNDISDKTRWKSRGNHRLPRFNNKYGKRTLFYLTPEIFNSIPVHIRNLDKISAIKSEIKSYLLDCL